MTPSRTIAPGKRSCSVNELAAAAPLYLAALLLLFAATGRTPKFDGRGYDGRFYAAMSSDESRTEPFIPVAPYCYRVLTPLLVAQLPGPVVERFRWFNLFTWFGVLIAWHGLARRTGLSPRLCLLGGLIFTFSAWGPVFSFYTPCYIDPLMYLLILIGLNLILAGRTGWLAVLLPVAMLQREHCAILWVCALVYEGQMRGYSRPLLTRYGLMLLPCAGVFVALRVAIPPLMVTTDPPWLVAIAVVRWLIRDPDYLLKSLLAILYAVGVPLVGWAILPASRRFVQRHMWARLFLLLAALSMLGGSDKARLVFPAQSVLIIVLLHGLAGLRVVPGLKTAAAALLFVHIYVQFPPPLMLIDGVIDAPLIDTVERATHGANRYYASHHPVALSVIAAHLAFSLGFASVLLGTMRYEARPLHRRTKTSRRRLLRGFSVAR